MPFDPERYAAGLRRENEREAVAIRESARRARAEAHRLAAEIGAADAEVRAVYLFGSLASAEPRHLDFDIDLALDGGDVYAAEEIAESFPFEVDVVSLARLPEETRTRIRESGEVLFTRGGRGAVTWIPFTLEQIREAPESRSVSDSPISRRTIPSCG